MKRFIKWMSATMVVMLLLTLPVSKVQAQDDYVSYQTFYDDLSPYGQWVNDPQYGNVWVPDAGNDFRPYYTNGYWAMTDYGNTWVSNYAWGWAPFHYGRWTFDPFYGWVWIPGNTWGPAWVSWRWGGGQCGWAPMGPGISMSMSFGNYNCPTDWWVFVGPQYMYQRNFHNYWRGPRYNNTYINQTTIINNTYNNTYVYGPRANEIERVTHQRVNSHRIAQGPRGAATVNNNTVNIYRPSVRGNASDGRPRNAVQAPRALGGMQGVRNSKPEFKQMVSRGEVKPMSANTGRGDRNNTPTRQQPGREQRFDNRDNTPQVRPTTNDRGRIEQMQQDRNRIDRQQMKQRQNQDRQRINQQQDRQQMEQKQNADRQRIEQNRQQRIDRPQMQRQQMEQRQNMDRQRMEQRQMEQRQRIDRPQPQRMEQQRQERPQMQQQRMEQRQPQRMEQRMERQQPQRMEQRPQQQRMEQRQSAPRPQPQMQRQEQRQSSPQNNSRGGLDRGGRR